MKTNMQPMLMNYTPNLSNYCIKVNHRHPDANNPNNNCRRNHAIAGHGGKGGDGGRGIGRGGQGGIGHRSRNTNDCRNDEWKVIDIDGKMIKVYPFYHFEQNHWFNISFFFFLLFSVTVTR